MVTEKIDYTKFICLNREHLDEFVPPHIIERLNDTLKKIGYYLPVVHKYLVINVDEPYAPYVEDLILQHNHKDEVKDVNM